LATKTLDEWIGEENAAILSGFRYVGSYIITLERPDVSMEIVGMLKSVGFDYTMEFLSGKRKADDILWNLPSMNIPKTKVLREIAIQTTALKGIKGLGKCRFRCGGSELALASKQTRSGDEQTTVFVTCVNCLRTWKQ
jgi:hypothetical protein